MDVLVQPAPQRLEPGLVRFDSVGRSPAEWLTGKANPLTVAELPIRDRAPATACAVTVKNLALSVNATGGLVVRL
ncbi:hypothetical protein QQY66_03115 [Streptomyces sp. DG2A-72]|uniref:hypothetical protein n=1 Tax=Streptomyces sp. DG2A-72 TaxID=3051386 RepID=UPI00265BA623|nr:hypothetical protein [Streptomyces sp. DG2A-72]MDO0930720.1 hypothetical protein [Streptomyces sp. DG2A-72]